MKTTHAIVEKEFAPGRTYLVAVKLADVASFKVVGEFAKTKETRVNPANRRKTTVFVSANGVEALVHADMSAIILK